MPAPRFIERLLPSAHTVEANELRVGTLERRCVTVANAPLAVPVTVSGTLRTVTLRPTADVAALEAELYDGTGTLVLIWLGRRAIRGVTQGRIVQASGRVTMRGEHLVMFNPTYELLPTGA
jgi:hypothetical protein